MSNYLTSGNEACAPGYLVLLRHGQTAWSVTGQYTGRTDLPLNAVGEHQAVEGGKRLREAFPGGFAPEDVYVSSLRRARQTAALAGFPSHQAVDGLMEWDYGGAEGRTRGQVSSRLGRDWNVWVEGTEALGPQMRGEWADEIAGGERVHVVNGVGETVGQVAGRAGEVLHMADRKVLAGRNVLLVAHAHVLRILTAQWLGLDPHCGRLLRFDTAHFSVLSYYKNDRVIDRWNL